jgi:hypothetical protein
MISTFLMGRFGNQLFQYSLCRLIADINKYDFHIPRIGDASTEGIHIKHFFKNLNLGEDEELSIRRTITENYDIQEYNEGFLSLPDNTKLQGFFQSPKYFDGRESIVKSWFEVDIDEKTKNLLDLYPPNEYCYIHVRGTDYKEHSHWFLDKKYYEDSINFISSKYPNLKFIVITDDKPMCSLWFPKFKILNNDMVTDFKLLFMSNYIIISNSSFSWWAAWLRDKEMTIAPNNWLNHNKPELGFYPKDIKTNTFIYI